jgi:hypothetical protein
MRHDASRDTRPGTRPFPHVLEPPAVGGVAPLLDALEHRAGRGRGLIATKVSLAVNMPPGF